MDMDSCACVVVVLEPQPQARTAPPWTPLTLYKTDHVMGLRCHVTGSCDGWGGRSAFTLSKRILVWDEISNHVCSIGS